MHAQVNFLQFEYGCFAPNTPAIMKGKIPKEQDRSKISMACIMKSLPGFRASLVQAGAAFTLSEFSDEEVFLLPRTEYDHRSHELKPRCSDPNYRFSDSEVFQTDSPLHNWKPTGFFPPRWLFTEKAVEIAYNEFVRDLREIQRHILGRRSKGTTPYEVLLPSKIPYGIAI